MDQDQPRNGRDPSRSQERPLAGNSSNLASRGAVQPSQGRPHAPPQRGGRPPIRGRRSNLLSGRFGGGRDLVSRDGGMGLLGPGPSWQRLQAPFLPPTLHPSPPLFHSQRHRGGSVDPPRRSSLNPPPAVPFPPAKAALSSSSQVNTTSATTTAPPPLMTGDSTKTDQSSSRVTTTAEIAAPPPPLKGGSGDVVAAGVSKNERRDEDPSDVLGLSSWIAKKRSLSIRTSSSSPNVEEAAGNIKVARKKTRLGWGEGLAKYEKELREQNAQKAVAEDGTNVDHGSSTTSSSAGGNGDPGKNKTSTAVNPAPTVPAPAVQDTSDHGSSSRSLSEMVTSSAEVPPAVSSGHILPPGGNTDPGNISTRTIEMVICPPVTGSDRDICDSRKSLNERVGNPTNMLSSSQGRSLPPVAVDDNNAFGSSSSSITKTGVCLIASSQGCTLPQDGWNITSTNDQGVPHKLMAQSSNETPNIPRLPAIILEKLQEPRMSVKKNLLSEQRQSDKLQGSRSSTWSQEEKDVFSEKIITFGTDFTKISAFLRHKTTTDCIEYYSKVYKSEYSKQQAKKCHPTTKQSQDKCKNENNASPFMSGIATSTATQNYGSMKTLAEDIKQPVHLSFHESVPADFQSHSSSDKGHSTEQSMEGNQCVTTNVTVAEKNAPSSPGTISPVTSSSQAVHLTLPKIKEPVLKNLNTKSCPSEEIRTEEQELWTDNERCHLIQATEKHGKDFASISVYVKTKSIEQCKSFLSKYQNDLDLDTTHVSSIDPCIATSVAELSGNEFVQALKNPETTEVDSTGSDRVKSNEENPQHCVASKESGGIQLICNVNSDQKGKEKVDIISSAENNDPKTPEVPTLDGEPKISHTPTNSGAAALNTDHAISSPVERDIDLNIPLDVDGLVTSVVEKGTTHGEASIGLEAPFQTSDDAVAMKGGEPKNKGKATMDSGADSENANDDVTHVQVISQSQTATPETSTQTANQPRCIRLFGQVIHQAPSLETNITFDQGNQIIFGSHDLALARDSRAYPSGPNTRNNVSVHSGQQSVVFSNMMPYGPLNSSAWPFRPGGSSALVNMSQHRPPVDSMAAYGMMRGGVPYPYHLMMPGSSSLINFNNFNPGQQLWQGPSGILDTSGMVIGYPFLPGAPRTQHAPTDFVPPRLNGDGPSTSNTRFPAPGRSRGRGRGRGRGNSPW